MARLLIIDDDPAQQKLFQDFLNLRKYEVRIAENIETGIEIARDFKPSLIIFDLHLKNRRGLDTVHHLLQSQEMSGIPLLAVTADVIRFQLDAAMNAGCRGLIYKPLNLELLIQKIEKILSEQKS